MKKSSIFPAFLLAMAASLGCNSTRQKEVVVDLPIPATPQPAAPGQTYLQPHKADVQDEPHLDPIGPDSVSSYDSVTYRQITLQECLTMAMSSSAVIRDLGVGIVRAPNGMITEFDPAATFSDPRFGEDAALSAFDANFVVRTNSQKNDRGNNNRFIGNSNGVFTQDLLQNTVEINKTAVTGTRFAIRHGLDYDFNNQAGNRWSNPLVPLPSSKSWLATVEAEFRHPLLQGGGVMFNRIAGPNSQPGFYNGVLIARSNTEISLARFEQGVRDLVSNIENAYWDLHFAYRDLDAAIVARDEAKKFWDDSKNKEPGSLRAISAEEQFYRFETAVINALEGQLTDGTRTDGGSAGGTFRSNGGVRLAERRLRYLLGMPHTDGTLLMPADDPSLAPVAFDWDSSLDLAVERRPELRQQSWVVKQRQLELTAAKNFLLPRLDLVALHRFRGLGSGLSGSGTFNDDLPPAPAGSRNSSAYGDLASGDYQEWQVGAELSVPLGFRQAHTAVRSAERQLQREKVVLREQQRAVSLALANALGELKRSYAAMEKANERYTAAKQYEQAAEKRKTDIAPDVVLEATRRVLEARQQFNRSHAEYMIAIKNVHFERGTLLDYNQVFLSESEPSGEAYVSAERRAALQGNPRAAQQNPPVALEPTTW